MAVEFLNIIPSKFLENTQSTQYTSLAAVTIIDKATITNITTLNVTVSINIVPGISTVSNENLILKEKVILPDMTYLLPELVGQALNANDFMSTLASNASSLTFRVSGRKIT